MKDAITGFIKANMDIERTEITIELEKGYRAQADVYIYATPEAEPASGIRTNVRFELGKKLTEEIMKEVKRCLKLNFRGI